MENDIHDLQKRIIAFRDARDWGQYHQPKELAISLAIEAAELMEKFQWHKGGTKEYQDEHREEIGEELADVFIYALNLAHQMGFDVKAIVEDKLRKSGLKYPVEKAKGSDKKYTEL